jgi:hypothetical protein
MPTPKQHVHAVYPQNVALWTAKLLAFCKGDINGISHCAVAALMAKIKEIKVSLFRDTVVKACGSSGGRKRLYSSGS